MNKLNIATIISASFFTFSVSATDKVQHLLNMHQNSMYENSGQEMTDKISATFGELDNDNDGYIDKMEANKSDIQDHFKEIDQIGDNDGKISRYEFSTYAKDYGLQVNSVNQSSDKQHHYSESSVSERAKIDKGSDSFDKTVGKESLGERHYNLKTNFSQNSVLATSNEPNQINEDKEKLGEKHYNLKTNFSQNTSTDKNINSRDKIDEKEMLGEQHYNLKTNFSQTSSYNENAKMDKIIHSFEEIDDDNSGNLSIQEADEHNISMHFGYIDDNEDKIVSYNEFIDYLAEPGYVTEK